MEMKFSFVEIEMKFSFAYRVQNFWKHTSSKYHVFLISLYPRWGTNKSPLIAKGA